MGNTDKEYIIVKMKKNDIEMFCDIEDLNLVKKYLWTPKTDRHGKTLIYRFEGSGKGRSEKYFHKEIFPDSKTISHINGNKLDNRRFNLKCSGSSIKTKTTSYWKLKLKTQVIPYYSPKLTILMIGRLQYQKLKLKTQI